MIFLFDSAETIFELHSAHSKRGGKVELRKNSLRALKILCLHLGYIHITDIMGNLTLLDYNYNVS